MRILIVDDHALVRAGLEGLLASLGPSEVAHAASGREALSAAARRRFDLIVLDLNLPGLGGLELLRRLVAAQPGPILVLSMHGEPLYASRSLEAGAAGYMTKNASPEELLAAARKVAGGGRYVEAELAQALAVASADREFDALTTREIEILRLLAKGGSLADIAAAVGVTYKTVANSCSQIKSKLGVTRTADLVRLAIESGVG